MSVRMRSTATVALAALVALALTACAGLPVSGPVKLGRVVAEAGRIPKSRSTLRSRSRA